jgi:hypothetical protein
MADIKEEEAATEAPREPPVDDDYDDNLYVQPQAQLAHRLALDGVVEPPSDVCVMLVRGLRSIYDDNNKYIELPKAMEHAFHAAIDAKAVASDTEPKLYRNVMRRPDSDVSVGACGIMDSARTGAPVACIVCFRTL